MNQCESNCFWSFNTFMKSLGAGFTGATIAALIGCAASGTLVFTDVGVACVTGLTEGMVIGFIIGLILGALFSYLDCKESCAGVGAVPPGNQGQGQTEEPGEPMTCEEAKAALEAVEAALAGAESIKGNHQAAAENAAKTARYTGTAIYWAIATTAAGAIWNNYVLGVGVILTAAAVLVNSISRINVANEGALGPGYDSYISMLQRERERAQKLVAELCKPSSDNRK